MIVDYDAHRLFPRDENKGVAATINEKDCIRNMELTGHTLNQ